MMSEFKQQLILECKQYLQAKCDALQKIVDEVSEAANNETKSSVGDKHETSRAMMQLEQEKLSKQFLDIQEQLADFNKIQFDKQITLINNASLIETNKGYFFIAASIGKLIVNEKIVFVISAQSPLAKAFMGSKQNSEIVFNEQVYTVFSVE